MTEPGESIPIQRPRPATLAERVTARIREREQQKGEKASRVREDVARRRKEKADAAKQKQQVAEDEGSTLEEETR